MNSRTCKGCRKQANKDDLVRIARSLDGQIFLDVKKTIPGRGEWLCPHPKCVEMAHKKRILFKDESNLSFDHKELSCSIFNNLKRRFISEIFLLRRQQKSFIGRECVFTALRNENISVIFLASDLSLRSHKEITEKANSFNCVCLPVPISMDDIAVYQNGKRSGVVAIAKSSITQSIIDKGKVLQAFSNFEVN